MHLAFSCSGFGQGIYLYTYIPILMLCERFYMEIEAICRNNQCDVLILVVLVLESTSLELDCMIL